MAWARRSYFQSIGRMSLKEPTSRRESGQPSLRGGFLLGLLGGVDCLLFLGLFRLGGFGHHAPAFVDARLAPNFSAQVVKASLPHVTMAQHVDLVDARRVDEERPLHPDAVRHPADREVPPQPATRHPDDGALEHLDALARALDDLCVHPHGVACTQRRRLLFLLLLLELLDHIHVFFNSFICAPRLCAACRRRHCSMRAWSPDSSTSGTVIPLYSAGRVNCGQPLASPAKVSWASDPGSPTTPGTSRATASIRTIAGISPPLST